MWNDIVPRTGRFVTQRMMRVSSSTRSSSNAPPLAIRKRSGTRNVRSKRRRRLSGWRGIHRPVSFSR